MCIADDDIYTLREELVVEHVDQDLVVLDLNNNRYAGINAVGATVFSLLDGIRTLQAIIREVAATHDVELEQAREDIMTFVEEAHRAGLIRPCTPDS